MPPRNRQCRFQRRYGQPRAAAAAEVWTPATTENYVLAVRASSILVADGAAIANAAAWPELTGSGNTMAVGVAPTYQAAGAPGSRPCATYNGTTQYHTPTIGTLLNGSSTPATIAMAVSVTSVVADKCFWSSGDSAATGHFYLARMRVSGANFTVNTAYVNNAGGVANRTTTGAFAVNAVHRIAWVLTGANLLLYVNGTGQALTDGVTTWPHGTAPFAPGALTTNRFALAALWRSIAEDFGAIKVVAASARSVASDATHVTTRLDPWLAAS